MLETYRQCYCGHMYGMYCDITAVSNAYNRNIVEMITSWKLNRKFNYILSVSEIFEHCYCHYIIIRHFGTNIYNCKFK